MNHINTQDSNYSLTEARFPFLSTQKGTSSQKDSNTTRDIELSNDISPSRPSSFNSTSTENSFNEGDINRPTEYYAEELIYPHTASPTHTSHPFLTNDIRSYMMISNHTSPPPNPISTPSVVGDTTPVFLRGNIRSYFLPHPTASLNPASSNSCIPPASTHSFQTVTLPTPPIS